MTEAGNSADIQLANSTKAPNTPPVESYESDSLEENMDVKFAVKGASKFKAHLLQVIDADRKSTNLSEVAFVSNKVL
jgi:hypothetical protein